MTDPVRSVTNCRICGSENLVEHLRTAGQALDRCRACTFVQVRDEPSQGTLQQIYSEAYFAHSKYRDPKALELEDDRRLSLLSRMLPLGASVLDAGCSTGAFVGSAKQRFELYGVDFSAYAVAQAREANPELGERLVAGRLEDAPFSDRRFDAICLWDVIEHLWDPVPVVKVLFERLKPGGYLFISTPAIDAPVARLSGRYWAFMTPPEHLGFFTHRSFRVLFSDIVPASVNLFMRRGKWTNLGFIGHKLKRIAPPSFPGWIFAPFKWAPFARLKVYVPTGDVQYLAVQKVVQSR